MSIALALRYPSLRSTILELPEVCPHARRHVAEYGLQQRVDVLAADIFVDPWPPNCDSILLSNVVNSFNDDLVHALLAKCFMALPAGGRIFVHEMLLADCKVGPLGAAAMSLRVHMDDRGRQRTAQELAEDLAGVGFAGATVTPGLGYYSVVVAHKPALPGS